jgi:hypothetical protein
MELHVPEAQDFIMRLPLDADAFLRAESKTEESPPWPCPGAWQSFTDTDFGWDTQAETIHRIIFPYASSNPAGVVLIHGIGEQRPMATLPAVPGPTTQRGQRRAP